MTLFDEAVLETWDPAGLLADLQKAGYDAALFERGEVRPDRVAVFHPDSQEQEILLQLFVQGKIIESATAQESLPGSYDGLIDLGLLSREGDRVNSELRLRVTAEGIFADDFPARLLSSPEDFVMGVASTTRMIEALVPCAKPTRILDLCCGGGYLAIKLHHPKCSVMGTDLNPRAIRVARFNARLNGVDGIDWREGSWYENAGGTFDLIISNPPFVISPGNQSVALDTADNETLLPAILKGTAGRLNPGGFFCLLLDWPFFEVEEWSRMPLEHLERAGLQILLFEIKRQGPEEYARHWVGQDPRFHEPGDFRKEVERWVHFLNGKGYRGLSSGFLVVRRCPPGDEWLVEESRELARFNEKTSVDLLRIFEGQSWLAGHPHEFLDLRFEVAEGLIRSSQAVFRNERWEMANLKLTSAGLVGYDGHIDEALLAMIDAAIAGRTIRSILPDLSAPLGVAPDAIVAQVNELVKELISLGLLLPQKR